MMLDYSFQGLKLYCSDLLYVYMDACIYTTGCRTGWPLYKIDSRGMRVLHKSVKKLVE
jgi:hypothetical protein